MLRLFVDGPLRAGTEFDLAAAAARHAQVRRVQPGQALVLFDGSGGEWAAEVVAMTRSAVRVRLRQHHAVERELASHVTLAIGMPAGERMDWLVEKATELGVACIQPLQCERSVLRVTGERAARKREHWQAVAAAAAEQCGRTRVPQVQEVLAFEALVQASRAAGGQRWLLSLRAGSAMPLMPAAGEPLFLLSGPEGGLSPGEEDGAVAAGWRAVQLGPRVLRAETAPLAVLAWLALAS
jgi:16S rRNA (uracil1498-N3)-methyltransferase